MICTELISPFHKTFVVAALTFDPFLALFADDFSHTNLFS
jgi:hypothetical protein